MKNPPRIRKRVRQIPRAPDGSAFKKCESCGTMVAISLIDMHECGGNGKEYKRFRGFCGAYTNVPALHKQSLCVQLRSPYRFFMESFMESGNFIENDRRGFETWKHMSLEERQPYVDQAQALDAAHQKALTKEVDAMFKVNDEADSAMVGKFDPNFEDSKVSDDLIHNW